MSEKITQLPAKTNPLSNTDLFEVSEDQGGGVFISKKISGVQLASIGSTGPQGPMGPQGVSGPVGPAGLNWQGAWSASGTYVADDAVGFGGASYFCLNPVGPSASDPSVDTVNWALLAAQGATGPQGPQGIAGPSGSTTPSYGQIFGNSGSSASTTPNEIVIISGVNGVTTEATNGSPDSLTIKGTFAFEIGEYVPSQGGIIVHRWASLSPISTASTLSNVWYQNYIVMDLADLPGTPFWGLNGTNVLNCESTWDGKTNTDSIMSAGAAVGTAAQLCDASSNGGKTDWYLPATDELSMIWQNRFLINLNTGITPGFNPLGDTNYWASTEFDSGGAWNFTFFNGYAFNNSKINPASLRAVRRFSLS